MAQNPFLKTPPADETRADETPVTPAPDAKPEGEGDAPEEPEDDELFGADDEPEGDQSDDDGDAAEADEGDDDLVEDEKSTKKVPPESIPYKRFSKVVKERGEARAEVEKLSERIDGLIAMNTAVAESYKDFKDPAAQIAYDSKFMGALEVLAKANHTGVGEIVRAVNHFMKTGEVPKMSNSTTAPAPERDTRVDAIVERDARRTIADALPENIRSGFRSVFTDYVLGTSENLAGLTGAEVRSLAKAFIKEKGFGRDEVYNAEKPAPKDKPATGAGGGKPVSGSRAKKAEAKPAADSKPKDLDEWQRNRSALIDSMFTGN
jgi:hypothetical protein